MKKELNMRKNIVKSKVLILVTTIMFLLVTPQFAQINETNIELGKIITFNSKVLNEERGIFIYLPVGYEESEEKYPVIYILDGRGNFAFSATTVNFLSRNQRMPRSIVVGIPNTDRTRDFTPVGVENRPTSGGADKFLKFLDTELIPYIDKNYRTQPYKTLYGHSLCGMFAIYTLFEKPEMFDSFIAVSPYLMYADQYVVNRVESILSKKTVFKKKLFITLGNEPEYKASLGRMEQLLSEKTEFLSWELSKRESEDHMSVPLKSLYDGLEFIYTDWRLPDEKIEDGFEEIKNHYSNLSDTYGYEVKPNEVTINAIGYQHLGKEEYESAIEIFEHNVVLYPKSANVYDSLGEAMEKAGKSDEAIENYKTAVKIGTIKNNRNLIVFKQNLERVESIK